MNSTRSKKWIIFALVLALVGAGWSISRYLASSPGVATRVWPVSKKALASVLGPGPVMVKKGMASGFPEQAQVSVDGEVKNVTLEYTVDARLQSEVQALFEVYQPDHGAFVAIEPSTGKIVALLSYARDERREAALVSRASYPAASVFKMVTAAAAIETAQFGPETPLSYNGGDHTLYRKNVFSEKVNRWTRTITLKQAFARSINTVFARIGAFTLGPQTLREFAERFGFNRPIPADFAVESARVKITPDQWDLAETASGYTRETTLSPIQGALMAAAIANDGVMMEPHVVEAAFDDQGQTVYQSQTRAFQQVLAPTTVAKLRHLMEETVERGTSKRSFRGFFKRGLASLEVGGKTGSLTGYEPFGKYDWFVGYAQHEGRKLAVAALTIHADQWRVKSAYLARKTFETYFDPRQQAAIRPSLPPVTELRADRGVGQGVQRAVHR